MEDLKYKLYDDLVITPRPDDKYKVLKEYTYKDVTVPVNFHTNGADIPRALWSIWPPNRSTYLPAVVIHDFLCDKKEYKKADKYFKEILEILEIGKATVFCFDVSTRGYHKIRYEVLKV